MLLLNAVGTLVSIETLGCCGIAYQVLALISHLAVVPCRTHPLLPTSILAISLPIPWWCPAICFCFGSKHLGRVGIVTKATKTFPSVQLSVKLLLDPLGVNAGD